MEPAVMQATPLPPPLACHREMPWIVLAPSAAVPQEVTARERRRLVEDLERCLFSLGTCESCIRRRTAPAGEEIEAGEVVAGWRKFFLAHYAFFHVFGLLGDLYHKATAELARERFPLRRIEQACSLWRLAGALMMYGIDFAPTEPIYRRCIRPAMPEGFSGTWLREYMLLTAARQRFNRTLAAKAEAYPTLVQDVRERLQAGEKRYHELHGRVMSACVPDLTSKLQSYQLEHGDFRLGETHFQAYDDWFHVLRLEIDLSGYVRSACAVLSELLADLTAGTFLTRGPLADLTAGIGTVLEVLRTALAPPGEETLGPVQ